MINTHTIKTVLSIFAGLIAGVIGEHFNINYLINSLIIAASIIIVQKLCLNFLMKEEKHERVNGK